MSVLAKVFVIIIFVFSLGYLTVSGALYHHKTDWRDAFSKLRIDYKNLQERNEATIDRLNHTISDYKDYVEDRENKILDLQQSKDQLGQMYRDSRTNLALETQEMALLLTDHSRVIMVLRGRDDEIRRLTAERDFFQREFGKIMAQKNTAENQVARLTNIKLDLEKDKSDLLKSYTQVRKELNDRKLIIQRLRDWGIPVEVIVGYPPPPPIDAAVLACDEPTRLVLLSVGRKQEVAEGYQFTIYRGTRFIARVQVERVFPDMSACRVVFEAPGEMVQRGDLAATRLH